MHLRSLSLRNYRVYRAVDLEFPDGLIGIYGANGSGKCLPGHVRIYDADAGGMVAIRASNSGASVRESSVSASLAMPLRASV